MMRINVQITPEIDDYIDRVGYREHEALKACRAEAATRGELSVMQIAPEQGAFLQLLIELTGACHILEIGTFTGYSALAMALALPESGRLVTCDVDPDIVEVARAFWRRGGVNDRIATRTGDAATTMRMMLAEGRAGSFDLVLIDADKPGYPTYVELAADLVRPGGLLVIDDTLLHGRVVTGPLRDDPDFVRPAVDGISAANATLACDERFTIALLPMRDGVTLARRR
jgi:O-methyltransferase